MIKQVHRGWLLASVCIAVFAINLDVTIVNVALPTISQQLHAGTATLQWIVDGYSLAFAALVLMGGSIGDRFGRRPTLLIGLLGFAAAAFFGAIAKTSSELIVCRFVMGTFAAFIYPTTLSIITNAYPNRKERTNAIGIWGAVTGIGVAVGPLSGGLLLAHFWYGSVFVALMPAAIIAAVAAFITVPESRQPEAARLDIPGLVLSSAAIGILVYTIIEAPARGWSSAHSLIGFAATVLFGALFVRAERRAKSPMIDVALFKIPAFSAASGAVTIAFFSLFGFIFLITQYLQDIRHYGTVSTGARILPVAVSIAAGSVAGALVVTKFGTRIIVMTGLIVFGLSFAWIAVSGIYEPYLRIAGQMILMGLGLGLTTTPATESILSVLPPAKAGVGSAVNDATREAGGALGVAVVGSVFSSIYIHHLTQSSLHALPGAAFSQARSSVGAAFSLAQRFPNTAQLNQAIAGSFISALHSACMVVALICWAGAIAALKLPGSRTAR